MSYLWRRAEVLYGGRLQYITHRSNRPWPGEDVDLQILASLVWLEPGQHVPVEQGFLSAHLPFHMASLGGTHSDGTPWLLELDAVPTTVVLDAFGLDADPVQVMREALEDALELNQAAHVGVEFTLERDELALAYDVAGVDLCQVEDWSTRDLVRGLLAEAVGMGLDEVVAGYPECAFPGQPHPCEHDVFDDVLRAWTRSEFHHDHGGEAAPADPSREREEPGTASPGASQGFRGSQASAGYRAWLAAHPAGWVAGEDEVIHAATCPLVKPAANDLIHQEEMICSDCIGLLDYTVFRWCGTVGPICPECGAGASQADREALAEYEQRMRESVRRLNHEW